MCAVYALSLSHFAPLRERCGSSVTPVFGFARVHIVIVRALSVKIFKNLENGRETVGRLSGSMNLARDVHLCRDENANIRRKLFGILF